MATMSVTLRSIPDTDATIGWSGEHSVVVDRPAGKAGGSGLGFNGGELLGLAIGGCFCNDLHYVAHDMGLRIEALAVDVNIEFDGQPLIATAATIDVRVKPADAGADVDALIARAQAVSTVSNSLSRGLPVRVMAPR
jgi:organic hydroperoxide reductase OsmC/OhrA